MELFKLVNPFKQIDSVSIVKLYPPQMNSDYYVNLKRNLEKKIIGRCNNDGMFTEVLKLVEYTENQINPESFSGDAEYKVRYTATICVPIEGTATILKVEKILSQYDDFLISATNGYIMCALPLSANKGIVHMDKGQIIFTDRNKPLVKGDYIKVSIVNKRIEANDRRIGIIGNLIDIATPEEVKLFYSSKQETIDKEFKEDIDENIFNDDNVLTEENGVSEI